MKVSTEIYQDLHGRHWKVMREGEDVVIEQAIEPAEMVHNPTYDKQQDLYEPVIEEPVSILYDRKAILKQPRHTGTILNRKV